MAYLMPAVLLIAVGQVLLKWRMNQLTLDSSLTTQVAAYLQDPLILLAYAMGLLGSFVWLFALARVPLTLVFPIYYGLVFALVLIGGAFALNEPMGATRLFSIALILAGVMLGIRSQAT